MIAGRLTMLALIERDGATAKDAWGGPVEPVYASTGAPVPCFVWSISASQSIDGSKTVEFESFRALFAPGADVKPGDVVASITDRRGVEIITGRLIVEPPVQRKHTHLEAGMRRMA